MKYGVLRVENHENTPRRNFCCNMANRLSSWSDLEEGLDAAGCAEDPKEYRECVSGIADALLVQAIALYECAICGEVDGTACERLGEELAEVIAKRLELRRDRN